MRFFVLGENDELVETDVLTWARWFGNAYRLVRVTELKNKYDGRRVEISSVFLGCDSHHHPEPYLYEQAIFYGDDVDITKTRTKEDAIESHQQTVDIYLEDRAWEIVRDKPND